MKNKLLIKIFSILCLSFGFLLGYPVFVYSQQNSLIISEINYLGSVDCPNLCVNDKWIEIFNPTTEVVNLKNWKIVFKNTDSNNGILVLPNFELQPNQNYLIGYKNVNLQSQLNAAGITPDLLSGKVLWVHNKEISKIELRLENADGQGVFEVNLNTNQFAVENGKAGSIEYIKGVWTISDKEFVKNNFGTPRNSQLFVAQPQKTPEPEPVIEVAPQPVVITEPTVTLPEPVTTPEVQISPKIEVATEVQTSLTPAVQPMVAAAPETTTELRTKPTPEIIKNPTPARILQVQPVTKDITSVFAVESSFSPRPLSQSKQIQELSLDSPELKNVNLQMLNLQLTELKNIKSPHFLSSITIILIQFYASKNSRLKNKLKETFRNLINPKSPLKKLQRQFIYY